MKKMIYFAAFAIMMAMGSMNAFADKNGARHNESHKNDKGKYEVRYDGHHNDMNSHKMSNHKRKMMAERRREEERRRMEEARRREAHHHHAAHHNEVVVVDNGVAAGVAVGVTLAALISALAQ